MADFKESFTKRTLILGSSSPRRKDLLTQAGFQFTIEAPDVDETLVRGETSRKMVERLAYEKASACLEKNKMRTHRLIIASDTTVVIGRSQTILGKPIDEKDAVKMLKKISGKAHEVLTAYCIIESKNGSVLKKVIKTVSTKVFIRKLDPREIDDYVKTGEPLDKAGSYAAQGIGMSFIKRIEGSYTNVVGLPMTELLETLRKDFKEFPRWTR